MTTTKPSNYSIGKDPHWVERVTDIGCATLTKEAVVGKSAGWETKGAQAPNTHLCLVMDSVRIHSLDSYRHSIVCKAPDRSLWNKANDGSDCSFSKYHTIDSFSTNILQNSKQPSSFLAEDRKARSKPKRTNWSSPGSYVAPSPPQMAQMGLGKKVASSLPSPSDRWVVPPPLPGLIAQAGQPGSWELCQQPRVQRVNGHAARRACLSGEPSITIPFVAQITAALNAEFSAGFETHRKGTWAGPGSQTGGACVADRPTDGLLQPDLVGDELGLVLKRQWQQPVSSWGKD